MWAEQLLSLAGRDSEREASDKAWLFCWFVVFHFMVEEWILVTNRVPGGDAMTIAGNALTHPRSLFAYTLTIAFILACFRRTRRLAVALAAAVIFGVIAFETFPGTANHSYLQLVILILAACFDPEHGEERIVLLQGCRLVMVVVLFYAGLKKALFGTYFEGQMFAVLFAESGRYGALRWILDAVDVTRLGQLGGPAAGAGPYRLTSPLGLLLSNAAYLAEIGCAAGMVVARTRKLAAIAAIGMIALIEIFAREVPFGIFFTTLVLLFLPARILRGAVVAFVLADVVMVLTRLEIFPWWEFV